MGKDEELLEAARNGSVVVVEKILGQRAKRSGPLASLRRGPGVNVRDSSGFSSLHHAALNGHKDIVRLLLEHDALTNIVDSKGSSPLHLAAWSGNVDIVRLMLSGHSYCDVNLKSKDDETALHCAAQYGHTAVVAVLLEHGCDPAIRNSRGENALDLAAQYGRLETVELLVRRHPFLIQQMQRFIPGTKFPHTPLHLASRNGHKVVVEVLLRSGLDVNILTPAGTALHEAALCGKFEVVKTLLEYGVDLHIKDAHNYTVKDLLSQFPAQATQEIMALLKRYKKMRHYVDSDGESFTQPFPSIPNMDSDLGSPYENVRPCSRGRSVTTDPSPGSSPHRWDFHRQARSVDCVEDRRISGTSATSMESDNSLYQIHCAPKAFMDSSVHSDDIYLYNRGDVDCLSLSSTTSSTGYPRRSDSIGAPPLYMPMNNARGGHSPSSSNTKVSPTPPKKPPRRNLSVSPTHLQTMSSSAECYSNNAYEYLYLSHSGTRSQNNINDLEQETRRERMVHGRSVDQYVEMNSVFNINLDDEEKPSSKELHRGKSEDLDASRSKEPVAITSVYENMLIKQQNPRRKLRRHPGFDKHNQNVYEEYELPRRLGDIKTAGSSIPENTFISNAYIMIRDSYSDDDEKDRTIKKMVITNSTPLSPTHYQQPPTPDHPPPSALQAEAFIHESIRPLSQEYKRRSKDMETETEDEYLLMCDESSGSFSSSVSLSDKSVDNVVEEYHSDAPFAGLIKGSTKVLENINSNKQLLERPKTLKKLKRVYDNGSESIKSSEKSGSNSSGSDKELENKENKVATLSPFDEQEEWAKIQEIMASFGSGIVRESVFVAELEKEFQNRLMSLNCSRSSLNESPMTIESWLQSLEMMDYGGLFAINGFDDVNFLNEVLDDNDLKDMGISSELERRIILDGCKQLPVKINERGSCNNNINESKETVDGWLKRIHLEQYSETFAKHLYLDMERVKRIWDVELSAVLDIEKVGHRKRILMSVSSGEHISTGPKLEDINSDTNVQKTNIQQFKSEMRSPSVNADTTSANTAGQGTGVVIGTGTGTIRHRHKKSRPAPPPPVSAQPKNEPTEEKSAQSEIFVGGSNSIKAQWRHQPILLITGVVKYTVNYLGSTVIKEFKGNESTKKSIAKIRKSNEKSVQEIILTISYRGLKFIDSDTQCCICEHEIRNINCACQDPEARSYFAYITKDQTDYYCHVFSTDTAEQATDIILTLGQAFELAYQMALRDQVTSKSKLNRESSHKPAVSPSSSRDFKDSSTSMARADLKLNGHPLKMKPLTLSIAASSEPIIDTAQHTALQRTPTKVNFSDVEA
ncbi:PREDICTED: uncharacterized protein LOC108564669 isoform X2 [Nicrophorus vespilloides]|uniref:Uncharacterized protein LOC108564669 isoform X2 n=1 Tax=Nicrophorus vespilloides TaxID=110193 RepID=A0ABM1MXE6_NICVS|nr:PREDICTED: uncharacterized protein LOC108564669 isoform X2 [Nicrophorus vespilloides]